LFSNRKIIRNKKKKSNLNISSLNCSAKKSELSPEKIRDKLPRKNKLRNKQPNIYTTSLSIKNKRTKPQK
ncbi:unnamed protein product, partial [Bubo scandiacus]